MAKEKIELSVFLIEAKGIAVYTSQAAAGVSFPFPEKIIQNMELLKHEDFHSFIAQICQAQKLTGHHVVVVFGPSLCFEKQVPLLTEEKLGEAVKAFRQSTPFDRVAARAYKLPTGNNIVAINRDFFDILKQSLERLSIHVLALLPQSIFTQFLGKQPLSAKMLQALWSKQESLVEQSIAIEKTVPKTLQEQEEYLSKRYSGLIVVAFIGFILLILAVTGFILRRQFQTVQAPKATAVPVQPPAVSPTIPDPNIKLNESSTPSAVQTTISFGPQNASLSAQIVSALKAQGFERVTSRTQSSVTVSKPLILFKRSVSPAIRSKFSDVLKTIVSDFSVQESDELEEDVSVTLGN